MDKNTRRVIWTCLVIEYRPFAIAKETKACLMEDPYWVAFAEGEKDFIADINEGDLYVSERDGKLVGFVCVNKIEPVEYWGLNWPSTKKVMVIHRMSVHPEYRRSGLGLELMKFAEVLAQSNNIDY